MPAAGELNAKIEGYLRPPANSAYVPLAERLEAYQTWLKSDRPLRGARPSKFRREVEDALARVRKEILRLSEPNSGRTTRSKTRALALEKKSAPSSEVYREELSKTDELWDLGGIVSQRRVFRSESRLLNPAKMDPESLAKQHEALRKRSDLWEAQAKEASSHPR